MDEYRLPETLCPDCGHHLDAAANLKRDGAPRFGDVTVCIYCSAALRFCAGDQLQKISDDELVELARKNPRVFSLLVKVHSVSRSIMKNKKTEPFITTEALFCGKKTHRRRRRRKNEPVGLRGKVEP